MTKIAYLSSQREGYVLRLDNKQGNPGMGPKLCEKTQELPFTELTLQVTCSNLFLWADPQKPRSHPKERCYHYPHPTNRETEAKIR